MKHLLTLLFLIVSFVSFSQGLSQRLQTLNGIIINQTIGNDLEIVEIETLQLELDDNIKKPLVEKLSDFEYFGHLTKNYESFKESFITIDLNNDGLLDIFYSGYLGGAADSYSFIFINTGTEFYLSYEGEIGSEFIYAVKESNKVCGLINLYTGTFDPRPQTIRLDFINYSDKSSNVENLSKYFDNIEQPTEFLNSTIKFKVLNEKYHLRSEPKINNGSKESGNAGNIVETYSAGTIGTAIAKEEDETGRIWWFVVLEDNFTGWMSSRYLEKQ